MNKKYEKSSGKTHKIIISEEKKISEIKKEIEKLTKIPIESQNFKRREYIFENTVKENDLLDESTLY